MWTLKHIKILWPGVILLSACTVTDSGTVIYPGSDLPGDNVENAGEDTLGSNPFVRARIIADILYEAAYAIDDNRLMLPAGNNAYDRYREVLDFDPGNAVAIEGINEIVVRYTELANSAMNIAQFDNAKRMLARAASINGSNDLIEAARGRLEEALKTRVDFFVLNADDLASQAIEILVRISEIGQYVRNTDATFLITARNDEEGRWIYKIMRESVGGFRLRGNIVLGEEPGIQVNIPAS